MSSTKKVNTPKIAYGTRSRINTVGNSSKLLSPGMDLKEKVAKLEREQGELKSKLDEIVKNAEEEKLGLLNEIKSLQLAIKIRENDHKMLILNLEKQTKEMSEEIMKLNSQIQDNKEFNKNKIPLTKTNKNMELKRNSPDSCEDGQNQPTYSDVLKATKTLKTKNKKSRVLLLADSHGRECSTLLSKNLKNFDVETFFKPGAPLNEVVNSARDLVKDFNKDDFLIVLGGTNDIEDKTNKHLPQIFDSLNKVVPLSQKTNVIINTVPFRFDMPELNSKIKETNKLIHNTINNLKTKNAKNLGICFLNERLKREHYTKHGLHLNQSGKIVLCDRLTEMIENRFRSPVKVTEPPKLTAKDSFLVKWLKTGKGK
jgi:hypothetical protein